MEYMQVAIRARRQEYERGGFVRWTVLDKHRQCAIGTVELFNRQAEERKAAVEQLGFAASEESITEIAHRCGFGGASYYCEVFKKYYGVSPLTYRKKGEGGFVYVARI